MIELASCIFYAEMRGFSRNSTISPHFLLLNTFLFSAACLSKNSKVDGISPPTLFYHDIVLINAMGFRFRKQASVPEESLEAPVVERLPLESEEAGRDAGDLEAVVGDTGLAVSVPRAVAGAGTIVSHKFTNPLRCRRRPGTRRCCPGSFPDKARRRPRRAPRRCRGPRG